MTVNWHGPIWYETNGQGPTVYPKEGGVYLIAEKDEYGEIVKYVGKTDDIRKRITEHRSGDEENEELKKLMQHRIDNVRVRFTKIHDESRKSNLERTAFDNYGGLQKLYNKKVPEGISLQNINFPI